MPRSTTGIDYGHNHQRTRARWAPLVATGTVRCWRCNELIPAGADWHLGHTDDTKSYGGPEHALCNLRAAANKTNRQRLNPRSRNW